MNINQLINIFVSWSSVLDNFLTSKTLELEVLRQARALLICVFRSAIQYCGRGSKFRGFFPIPQDKCRCGVSNSTVTISFYILY
jgi:hypothetical protein